MAKHKVFISYYHKDDQYYKERFETLYGHLFINKSVQDGDISTDVSADYISRLIIGGYISDASVLVVLIGNNTKKRKHVDWEISAALNKKVNGYSGLIAFLLPTHDDYSKGKYTYDNIPQRLAYNVESGYAKVYDWTENVASMSNIIETAFNARVSDSNLINNKLIQFTNNRP